MFSSAVLALSWAAWSWPGMAGKFVLSISTFTLAKYERNSVRLLTAGYWLRWTTLPSRVLVSTIVECSLASLKTSFQLPEMRRWMLGMRAMKVSA